MTVQPKKERERSHLDLFRSVFTPFPGGVIEANRERPDFLVRGPEGNIGIEMTRVYQQSPISSPPRQAQESERERLVSKAERIYDTMGLDPVQVHVRFAGDTQFNKSNRDKYALSIAELVANNLPPHNSWVDLDNQYDSPAEFPLEIHSINIARYDVLTRDTWSVPDGGFVQKECRLTFQRAIDEKESLLPTYDRDCLEHWLLIVADWSGPSSFFDPAKETISHTYRATFDRVFFLNAVDRKYFELHLDRGAG